MIEKFKMETGCFLLFLLCIVVPFSVVAQDKKERPAKNLEPYVGSYEVAPGVDIEITLVSGRLHLQAPGQQKVPLQADPDGSFSIPGANVQVVFNKDTSGAITGFKLHQGGNITNAKKKGPVTRKSTETKNKDEKTRADILSEIKKIEQHFSREPEDIQTRSKYGKLLYQAGEFWRARKILAPLVKSPSVSNEILQLAAELEYLVGNHDVAAGLFERLIAADGGTMAKANLLFSYYQTDQFQKAKKIKFPSGVNLPNFQQMKEFDVDPYQKEWDNAEKVAIVPFLMTDPLPVLEIEVNGVPVIVIFDTGGDQLILDNEIADAMGIKMSAKAIGTFGGGKQAEIGFGKVDRVKLGGVTLKHVPVTILPTKRFSSGFKEGRYTIGGIIGTSAMRQFLGTLDYKNERLVLRERSKDNARKFRKELKGKVAAEVPFVLRSTHLMMARGSLNGKDGLTFFVDSGLASEASFSAPVQTLKYAEIPLPEVKEDEDGTGGGGGTYATGVFPIKKLGLGSLRQSNIKGEYGSRPPETYWALGFIQDGLISHQFFRQYSSWTIDFDSMKYIFEK